MRRCASKRASRRMSCFYSMLESSARMPSWEYVMKVRRLAPMDRPPKCCAMGRQLLSSALHLPVEPGPGKGPISLDGCLRNPQCQGGLFHRQAAKAAALNHSALPLIHGLQTLQGLVEVRKVLSLSHWHIQGFDQWHRDCATTALVPKARARVIDQHSSHDSRRHSHEVSPVPPLYALDVRQPQVGFVHQRRGVERVARPFVAELSMRN